MKNLLTVTAVLEAAVGLLFVMMPSRVTTFLLGAPLDTPVALTVARVTGVALLALGVACWFARDDGQSRAARGLVSGMLVYDVGVVALLVYASLGLGLSAIALWPAVLIHTVMAVWCVASLRNR